MTDNVLNFPNAEAQIDPKAVHEKLTQIKIDRIQLIFEELVKEFHHILSECNLVKDAEDKTLMLFYEVFRSYLLKIEGINHPLQKFSELVYNDIDMSILADFTASLTAKLDEAKKPT